MLNVVSVTDSLLDLNPGSGPTLASRSYQPTEEEQVTDPNPIACTLDESDLRQRLEQIAALGADALIAYDEAGGTHTLRFRRDDGTRRRLEQIVAAEAKCCSFLDLRISECADELLLTIDAAGEGRALAGELASAFSATR
jgi:hypothetical protein